MERPQLVQCLCSKNSGVHTQPWLCQWETNIMAQTEPYTIPANKHGASGAQTGGVTFDWLLSTNIGNLL